MGWTNARGYSSLEHALEVDKTQDAVVKRDYFLYFINAGPFTKIGLATNPDKRVQELQVGCPIKIQKFRLFYAGEEDLAFLLERRLHKFFESKHSSGEWFVLDQDDFAKIRNCKKLCHWNKSDPFTQLTSEEAWNLANQFLEVGLESSFAT